MRAKNAESAESARVRQYLATVEREAAALPADHRQELVADLAEHIDTGLAERPGSSQDILRELGDPRTIAATALQESGIGDGPASGPTSGPMSGAAGETDSGETAKRRSPAWVVVGLPVLALVLGVFIGIIGLVLRIVGVVVLCRSRHWEWDRKWVGAALTAVAPTVIALTYNFGVAPNGPPPYLSWVVTALMMVLVIVSSGWLWKVRKQD